MIEQQEKDNFWLYVGAGVIAFGAVVFMIKGGEHGKYETAKKLIAEDAHNSAYAIGHDVNKKMNQDVQ
ncbi:hypothetical protein [Methylobacter sp. sgz302048]|jgi:hypothetical protein|uniref:hypothetical protein n=1 Tax=Methylobacter sp. sgz302048 TaxID=3455945 RepID=UPI003F9FF67A